MRIKSFYLILFVLVTLFSCENKNEVKSYNEGLHIVPEPKMIEQQTGEFTLTSQTAFVTDNDSLKTVAGYFAEKIQHSTGHRPDIVKEAKDNCIRLTLNPALSMKDEGYKLIVTSREISVQAKSAHGIFYAMQTVMQLLPAEIESEEPVKDVAWTLPCVVIEDEPAYPYRGMMLDVSRHFHDVDFVKKQLDVMAMFKINRFHWHLTNDHLWTIEIKKYPKLTEIGSIRHNADGTIHQGYYTQEQIREVVAYAAERFITVIPEVELPGHALAALTAYPELSCTGGPFQLRNKWGVEENVYCAGNEQTFKFLEDVLEEVIPLFPGKYFHIGGDECPKKKWNACPKCQKRIRDEKLKDAHGLQSYFVHRIEKVLLEHGKSMIGWDEILEGGLAPTATVMSWRGEEGGIEAASMGHDVIMTPAKWLYLDFGQGNIEVEPIAINFTTLLSKTYNYNPASEKIPTDLRSHVLGAQGNMWTEYATTPDYTEYLLYPRILAVAELTWTPLEKKDYASFERRLNNQLVRLDEHHINYHIPLPEGPMADRVAIVGTDTLSFSNSRNLPMVYTLDGSEPTIHSTVYNDPIIVSDNQVIRIATFLPSGKMSRTRVIEVVKENLLPAYKDDTKPGIQLTHADGDFYYVKDTENAVWKESKAVTDFELKPVLEDKGAFCYSGYFEVPCDGVYYLSTEMDELQVDGKVVLSNDGKLIRHSHSRTSLALQQGKHAFRLLFINNNIGGYLRVWNNKGFIIGQKGEELKLPVSFTH
ncbi:family 20 glycosylhydrolase [Bacteroides nordii]|uniref:beta-N-acetylhexosaminidase n=1 Tax=Bacteroides nordii TaxID=291645 RepID=A0A413VYR9_9BACE|nr:family 20 glycosylhydrolase [Bacteroides nordii]RHB38709.1 beta-hexosaminidase [Bacteroides nordii]